MSTITPEMLVQAFREGEQRAVARVLRLHDQVRSGRMESYGPLFDRLRKRPVTRLPGWIKTQCERPK